MTRTATFAAAALLAAFTLSLRSRRHRDLG